MRKITEWSVRNLFASKQNQLTYSLTDAAVIRNSTFTKKPMLQSIFNKTTDLKSASLLKETDLQHY